MAAQESIMDDLYVKYFAFKLCPVGSAGINCDKPCDAIHGTSNRKGECVCESQRWTGADCSTEVMEELNDFQKDVVLLQDLSKLTSLLQQERNNLFIDNNGRGIESRAHIHEKRLKKTENILNYVSTLTSSQHQLVAVTEAVKRAQLLQLPDSKIQKQEPETLREYSDIIDDLRSQYLNLAEKSDDNKLPSALRSIAILESSEEYAHRLHLKLNKILKNNSPLESDELADIQNYKSTLENQSQRI